MKASLKKIVSTVTMLMLLVSSAAILKADAATQRRQYYKYVYATDTLTTYWLDHSDAMPNTAAYSTLGVIGSDDRFRDGHSAIVCINGATGFIVSDHVIATAAHCVSSFANPDGSATTSDFFNVDKIYMYGSNGIHNGTRLTPIEVHVPVERKSSDYVQKQKFDYALLTVAEDLSEYGRFALGYAYDTTNETASSIPVFSTGFPTVVDGETVNGGATARLMYTGYGYLYEPTEDETSIPELLYYDIDITPGNSGGPVYTITEYTIGNESYSLYTAISLSGIYSDNRNWGPRFDSKIIQFYLSNDNIGY